MKARLVVTLGAAAAMALTAGLVSRSDAAAGSSTAGTIPLLRVGFDQVPTVVNTYYAGGDVQILSALSLENLVRVAPDGSIHPYLATSVTRPSPATYVYHLRHGVKFWDGNEMTADDVANALNYYRFPGAKNAGQYASVKNVKATDRYTVTVTLKFPDARWAYVPATYGPVFEKAFADAHPGQLGKPGTLTMGTGPWIIDSLDPTSGAEESANPHWWGGKVPIDHISIKFITSATARALAFRSGALDAIAEESDAVGFAATANHPALIAPSCNAGYLALNTQVAPFNDIHVRRAIAYAINRTEIVAAAAAPGTAALSTLILPSQLKTIASASAVAAMLKSLPSYPFNLAKAKQELAKSAFKNGFSASLENFGYDHHSEIEQVIAADVAKIGIKIQVNSVPQSKWHDDNVSRATPAFFWDIGCPIPDPGYYPGRILGSKNMKQGATNDANYGPRAVDDLIAAGLAAPTAKRLDIYKKLLTRLALDVPYVPLYSEGFWGAISDKFTWKGFNFIEVSGYPWALDIKAKK